MIIIKCFSVKAELEWGKKELLVLYSHHSLPAKDVISSRWNQHKCSHVFKMYLFLFPCLLTVDCLVVLTWKAKTWVKSSGHNKH